MSNKTYNLIINLISFITSIAFVVCKVVGVITASWWLIVVPFILAAVFRHSEDEDDEGNESNNNNLKMA